MDGVLFFQGSRLKTRTGGYISRILALLLIYPTKPYTYLFVEVYLLFNLNKGSKDGRT